MYKENPFFGERLSFLKRKTFSFYYQFLHINYFEGGGGGPPAIAFVVRNCKDNSNTAVRKIIFLEQ